MFEAYPNSQSVVNLNLKTVSFSLTIYRYAHALPFQGERSGATASTGLTVEHSTVSGASQSWTLLGVTALVATERTV